MKHQTQGFFKALALLLGLSVVWAFILIGVEYTFDVDIPSWASPLVGGILGIGVSRFAQNAGWWD